MPVGNHNYSLLTDLYQLTMAQGYWECNKRGRGVFSRLFPY